MIDTLWDYLRRRALRPTRRTWRRWFGDRGEREASRFLKRRGTRVLTRQYRTARGEIDLVCRERDILVFVEVKTRQRGEPARAVTFRKRQRLIKAGKEFLRRHGLPDDQRHRFDVVAIVWPDEGRGKPEVQYYPDAFRSGDP
jgi:putative endonuclease